MQVGFIGLGTTGSLIAHNLRQSGHRLVVHDLRREAAESHLAGGARWAENAEQVALQTEVVFTSLPGPAEIEAVALGPNGILAGIRPGAVYFDLSTNSPSLARGIHAAFADRHAHMLDAPISGGPAGAASRRLALWVGGEQEVFERHQPLLREIGEHPCYVGPCGAGAIAKLVHNCIGYVITVGLGEVFTLGVKAGLDALDLWEAVRHGAMGRRKLFDLVTEQFLPNRYEPPNFALRLAHKDVSLATSLGRELGVPMRLANLTLEEMTEALNRGWGDRDSRVVMALEPERAGVTITVEPERLRAALALARQEKP